MSAAVKTMQDIARTLGISQATVSAALSGTSSGIRISPAMRRKVIKAARDIGYIPSPLARAMSTGATTIIAFLGYDMAQEYSARILEGALLSINETPYTLKVFALHDPDDLKQTFARLAAWRVRGLICKNLARVDVEWLHAELKESSMRAVYIGEFPPAGGILLAPDDREGGRMATAHLIDLGHRRIGLISHGTTRTHFRERTHGYFDAMRSADLNVAEGDVLHARFLPGTFDDAVGRYLRRPDRPTAVVCGSDVIAVTVARVALDCGLRVPGDLSLVGYDDTVMGRHSYPQLTTIAQPCEALGREAARRLIDPSPDADSIGRPHTIPVQLIVRNSSAPPRKTG